VRDCWFSAITLLLLGAASIIIGVCYSVPPLVIAGGIAVAIGLLLFILWAVFCARFHVVQRHADGATASSSL